tara:strand:+ start:2161 stop:2328 length:168 start_codon:yes stop_codon:yes gene_type:complete
LSIEQHEQNIPYIFQRLKHNVQFVDLQDKEVVDCQRMENGVVGCKRKRNACVESV